MLSSEIEPATFLLLGQCINQLRHLVPFLVTCSIFIKSVLSLDTSRNCYVIVQNVMEQIVMEVALSEFEYKS